MIEAEKIDGVVWNRKSGDDFEKGGGWRRACGSTVGTNARKFFVAGQND